MEKKAVKKNSTINKNSTSKKSTKVVVEKKSVPEEQPTSEKVKNFLSSYYFLYTVFGLLLVLVVFLAIMVTKKSNSNNKIDKGDIVFSIIEKNTNSDFNIGLMGLIGKRYALKVTNSRNGVLCSEDIPYKIHIVNNSDVEIEVLKDGGADNLMINNKETIIEAPALGCSNKEETIYYIKITNSEKIKENDNLKIEVIS